MPNTYSHRKLTSTDGEHILLNAIEYLYNISDEADGTGTAIITCGKGTPCEYCQAICTCRTALGEVQS